jgi:hypothetical protein
MLNIQIDEHNHQRRDIVFGQRKLFDALIGGSVLNCRLKKEPRTVIQGTKSDDGAFAEYSVPIFQPGGATFPSRVQLPNLLCRVRQAFNCYNYNI